MSLHVLLAQLNANPIFSIIPVGEQHTVAGDPATAEGRAKLLDNASVMRDAVRLDLDPDAKTSGSVTAAHACLVLTLPWMLSVDSTGTPFFALSEEGMPGHLASDHGTWFSAEGSSEVFYKPDDNGTTVFLYNGRLLGDDINVTLRDICDMPEFQTPWYDPDDSSGVLPAQPNAVAVLAKLLTEHNATAKERGYMASAFSFLWDTLFPEHPDTKDISYNLISWLRDRSFQSSPERDANIIDPDIVENLRQTVPQLPGAYNEHSNLVHDTATTGHEVMKRAALLAHMTRYIASALKAAA